MARSLELIPTDLRCICDPKSFDFKKTSEIDPLEVVIGQERAVQAIDFGLNMEAAGYNIFITGLEGTGKSTIVRDLVTAFAKKRETPSDWVMVNNFEDEFCPRLLPLPTGAAGRFKKEINKLIKGLRQELPQSLSSKKYQNKVSELQKAFAEKQQSIFQALDEEAAKKGLIINKTQQGFQTIPLKDGKPMEREAFEALTKEEQKKIETDIRGLQTKIEGALHTMGQLQLGLQRDVDNLMAGEALFVVKSRIEVLKKRYKDQTGIITFLEELQNHIVENVGDFLPKQTQGGGQEEAGFGQYEVNVLVDRKRNNGAPVIFETNPTFQNVFGYIEKRAYMGTLMTDFTMVQAGSLLRANGGYLIMELEAVLRQPMVWEALKRALQNKTLVIEDLPSSMGFGITSLRPEPIPLNVKVILMGPYPLFYMLQNHDAKFNKIFKVRADFDHEVVQTSEAKFQFAQFVARSCKEEGLMPFTATGVAAMVEYSEKLAADKNKLSLRFGLIVNALKEADYWARQLGAKSVAEKHVRKALAEHRFRYNLYEEKSREAIADEIIMIDVKGKVIGQVNALAVYQMGDIAFGRPSRITAETYMGKAGVINIEREANMSGSTHDKGVMILSGFLGRTFAQRYPLNLAISITFEQNYGGIDGDSASSTELYAILSSLSGLPIDQGIAVTGSVNQKGEVQAIGGVTQKVEGFFDVCRTKGLTGRQGVMIPKANVKNLMVSQDVLRACKKGKFHLFGVSTIAEGIEILTGAPAGKPNKNGDYPGNTAFGKVQEKLEHYLRCGFRLKKTFGPDENGK